MTYCPTCNRFAPFVRRGPVGSVEQCVGCGIAADDGRVLLVDVDPRIPPGTLYVMPPDDGLRSWSVHAAADVPLASPDTARMVGDCIRKLDAVGARFDNVR